MSDHPQSPQHPAALGSSSLDPDALNIALDGQFAKCCSIGIRFDRLAAEARGCLLGISESPLHSAPEILAVQTETLTSELLRGLVEVEQDSTDLTSRELLHSELTVMAIRIAERLFADAINSRFIDETDSILAIGIHGDGVWNCETDVRCYHEMVDVSRIAEHFGRTVVTWFSRTRCRTRRLRWACRIARSLAAARRQK